MNMNLHRPAFLLPCLVLELSAFILLIIFDVLLVCFDCQ